MLFILSHKCKLGKFNLYKTIFQSPSSLKLKVQDPNNCRIITGLKINISSVPNLNKSKFSQILVEPGTIYTRAAFSTKSGGMIWRMTKKRQDLDIWSKNIL